MARKSVSDQIIIDMAEGLISRIHEQAGVDKSITQVLQANPLLLGETVMIVNIFVAATHLKIEDPMLRAFIEDSVKTEG